MKNSFVEKKSTYYILYDDFETSKVIRITRDFFFAVKFFLTKINRIEVMRLSEREVAYLAIYCGKEGVYL